MPSPDFRETHFKKAKVSKNASCVCRAKPALVQLVFATWCGLHLKCSHVSATKDTKLLTGNSHGGLRNSGG